MLLLLFVTSSVTPTLSADYEELLNSVSPDFVALVEVQPMEPLGAWTAAGGGLTNTYYCTFSTQIATDISGGLYRSLNFVRQDALNLTEQGSAAAVNANLGSYWNDTSTSRIYVSTTTGIHPDNFALIGAWFTLRFSTRPVPFSDQALYLPLVTGSLPTLSAEMPETMFGAIVASTGEVSLLNGDGLFDKLSQRYIWRNKTATFKLGGASLDYADFATIETMRINGLDVGDEYATLKLEDESSVLNQSLPKRTWGDGTISGGVGPENAADGIAGLSQPLVFGTVPDCPLVLGGRTIADPLAPPPPPGTIDAADFWYGYDFNSGPYGSVVFSEVTAVERTTRARTVLSLIADYDISGATVRVYNPAYFYETHDIIATLTQVGTITSPKFGTMARAILELCGVASVDIDGPAFVQANQDAPQVLARYVSEPIQAADLLRELERTVNGQVYRDAFGRWTCRVLDPSFPAPDVNLTETDFSSWQPTGDLTTVLNEVRVRHSHRPFGDDWTEASSSSDAVRYASETSDSHRIDTWLTSDEDASVLAGRLLSFRRVPATTIEVEERGLRLMSSRVGDLVSVTRSRAPLARTGRYDGQYLRIVKIEKSLGPDVPTVRAWLNDLDGRADRVFRLAPSGYTATWFTASEADKAFYGFLADTNGYLDSTDSSTKDGKGLW